MIYLLIVVCGCVVVPDLVHEDNVSPLDLWIGSDVGVQSHVRYLVVSISMWS